MKLIFSGNAWKDHLYWQKTDKNILNHSNTYSNAVRVADIDSSTPSILFDGSLNAPCPNFCQGNLQVFDVETKLEATLLR
ncbi:type II toxin-antitoxin system YoeB family toxin [Halomonas salinarum]|uniref:type II toxin-antitoxin system YoeB family toxin n=1 Tax=Halomonas salinarum TaxID=1158993 RepID=UPI001438E1CD|nr:type II toxin-antitoxin system YoeB family toxin [Halomonas salinarum]